MKELLKGAALIAITALVMTVANGRASDGIGPVLIVCQAGTINRAQVTNSAMDTITLWWQTTGSGTAFSGKAEFHDCTIVPEDAD